MKIRITDINSSSIQKIMDFFKKFEVLHPLSEEDIADMESYLHTGEKKFRTKGLTISYNMWENIEEARLEVDIDDNIVDDMIDIGNEVADWTLPFLPMIKKAIQGIVKKVKDTAQKWKIPEEEQEYCAVRTVLANGQKYVAMCRRNKYEGAAVMFIMDQDWDKSTAEGKLYDKLAKIEAKKSLDDLSNTLIWKSTKDEAIELLNGTSNDRSAEMDDTVQKCDPEETKQYALLRTHIGKRWFSAIVCKNKYGTNVLYLTDKDWETADNYGKDRDDYAMFIANKEIADPDRLQWFDSINEAIENFKKQ